MPETDEGRIVNLVASCSFNCPHPKHFPKPKTLPIAAKKRKHASRLAVSANYVFYVIIPFDFWT
jgi:hypothetical protein